jgi:hypothetical protein
MLVREVHCHLTVAEWNAQRPVTLCISSSPARFPLAAAKEEEHRLCIQQPQSQTRFQHCTIAFRLMLQTLLSRFGCTIWIVGFQS